MVSAPGFGEAASACLRDAQAALTDLLDDAGLAGARPTEIGRALGVDKTLAWKISRFVEEPDAVIEQVNQLMSARKQMAKMMKGLGGRPIASAWLRNTPGSSI